MLQTRDVPASRVFTMADIFRDPHFAARETITHAPDPVLGSIAMPAPAPRLSGTPGEVRHAGGDVGANTVEVLRTIGRMSEGEIKALLDSGAAFDLTHTRGLVPHPKENPE
jgi:crotonobetainyl-CoA:carnitine CoA-transferase CaiB-like acyl-CoA transferase